METIMLSGKKELDIFINPQRQRLLRFMSVAGRPMTPKQLSEKMGISPSSVQHHLSRLADLNLVMIDHVEKVHGITAHFYIAPPRTVRIGFDNPDENTPQRIALIQNSINDVLQGVINYYNDLQPAELSGAAVGDVLWGIARLKPQEATELFSTIHRYLQEHEGTENGGNPWEYALIAYPVKEKKHA